MLTTHIAEHGAVFGHCAMRCVSPADIRLAIPRSIGLALLVHCDCTLSIAHVFSFVRFAPSAICKLSVPRDESSLRVPRRPRPGVSEPSQRIPRTDDGCRGTAASELARRTNDRRLRPSEEPDERPRVDAPSQRLVCDALRETPRSGRRCHVVSLLRREHHLVGAHPSGVLRPCRATFHGFSVAFFSAASIGSIMALSAAYSWPYRTGLS